MINKTNESFQKISTSNFNPSYFFNNITENINNSFSFFYKIEIEYINPLRTYVIFFFNLEKKLY